METRTSATRAVAALMLLPLLQACNTPAGPKDESGALLRDFRLQVVGPGELAPGQSAQFTATLIDAVGSSRPATGVTWISGQPALFSVTAEGVVTAVTTLRGEGVLQAEARPPGSSSAIRASREIMVLPTGTFRLLGTVMEAGATNIPVYRARLEVTRDPGFADPLATFATTGPDGRFKLYGVPGDSYLRIVSDGYALVTDRIQLASHATRNYELPLAVERLRLEGNYHITFEASRSDCDRGGLPGDLSRRTYEATIRQNGPALAVTLTSPQFLVVGGTGNWFGGGVNGDTATFDLWEWGEQDFYWRGPTHPAVAERLPENKLLAIAGRPRVTGTSDHASGPMYGFMGLYQGGLTYTSYLGGCFVDRMTLTRR